MSKRTIYQREWRKANPDKVKAAKKRQTIKEESRVKARERSKVWRANNVERSRKNGKKWAQENPEQAKEAILLRLYGINIEYINNLVRSQFNSCAICGVSFLLTKIAVDHSHTTGKVRGLLCGHCNKGLGFFRESVLALRTAIIYLEREENGEI